jgi:hypothetical protein
MNHDLIHIGFYLFLFIIIWMVIVNFLTLRKVRKYHELQTAELQMKLLR